MKPMSKFGKLLDIRLFCSKDSYVKAHKAVYLEKYNNPEIRFLIRKGDFSTRGLLYNLSQEINIELMCL